MEIVPGVKARGQQKTDVEELVAIRAKVAQQQTEAREENARRKEAILAEVRDRIANGDGPIRVTEEMELLGIAEQVWTLVRTADATMSLRNALMNDEDRERDYDDPKEWLD